MTVLPLVGLAVVALLAMGGGSRRSTPRARRLSALDRELVRFARALSIEGRTDAQLRASGMTRVLTLIDGVRDDAALAGEADRAEANGYPQIAAFIRDAIATRQSQQERT